MVSAAFGFYETLIAIVMIAVGIVMGIAQISPEDGALYGVTVVFLITISEYLHWILRQIILVESLMVSAERILQIE